MSETEASIKRSPLGGWRNRVEEEAFVDRDGLNKQRNNVWIGRDGGCPAMTITLGVTPREREVSETIDR